LPWDSKLDCKELRQRKVSVFLQSSCRTALTISLNDVALTNSIEAETTSTLTHVTSVPPKEVRDTTRDPVTASINEPLSADPDDLISLHGDHTTFHDDSDAQPLVPSPIMEPDLEACKESEESGTPYCLYIAVGDRGSSKLIEGDSAGKHFSIKTLFAVPSAVLKKLRGIWETYAAPHFYKRITQPHPWVVGLVSSSGILNAT